MNESFVDLQQKSAPPAALGSDIPYERFLDCVHCGLCTAACPTYLELGNENDGPRGRIYLMRAVTDARVDLTPQIERHLELCLDCRACETACPSGVQYGRLIEPFRVAMEQHKPKGSDWFQSWILFGLFPYANRMKAALRFARWSQRMRLDQLLFGSGILRWLPPRVRQLVTMLPTVPPPQSSFPQVLPAKGKRRARVALFRGCVGDALFGPTNWATARVLQENGCDVIIPSAQVCCGAIHYHGGQSEPAKNFADQNLRAFQSSEVDAIIVNVAGCGSMLKDYGHHWHDELQPERTAMAGKVQDVHEFLDRLGLIPPQGPLMGRATYHDACHLAHAQRITEAPRRILQQIPQLEWTPLTESEVCCGAAGTYNLTEPEMADRLGKRKLGHIASTKANIVVTANAGCLLQMARHARQQNAGLRFFHPMDLLDLSYRKKSLEDIPQ
ncbi:MAG: heterodisulfide reductase-related iron-sulfur binding cluster [Planctomycetota bacterium]|nr:heterodisulfide reductase-related iron-sulfur binding cluster [Planctomycetota bacterium]